MSQPVLEDTVEKIVRIVGNPHLANSLNHSISEAIESPNVHMGGGRDVWSIFETSLKAAIRDIENHELGKLFRRLIEYGPHNPDDPKAPTSDGETVLSDLECAQSVEFIYSHMINRFKGELAELLAMKPLIRLARDLVDAGELPSNIELFFGDIIQEKRARFNGGDSRVQWSGYAKGADGLILCSVSRGTRSGKKRLGICGVIEVKSMHRPVKSLEEQLEHHVDRMAGGLMLSGVEWNPADIVIARRPEKKSGEPVFVMVIPSKWKIDRSWSWEQDGDKRVMRFPEPSEPMTQDAVDRLDRNRWKVALAWSQEALNQAAYEMTFWYMSQVGEAIYGSKPLPKGWEGMTPGEAGYNAIKMMLYYIPLRIRYMRPAGLDREQLRRFRRRIDAKATRLYNVYCFGYPLGSDSREMLWPEDFAENSRTGDQELHG